MAVIMTVVKLTVDKMIVDKMTAYIMIIDKTFSQKNYKQ